MWTRSMLGVVKWSRKLGTSLTVFHPSTSLSPASIALISLSSPSFSSSVPILVTSHCGVPVPVSRRWVE